MPDRAIAHYGVAHGEDLAGVAERLFYAMPTHTFADGREVVFSEATYDEVRNDWRDPRRAPELKIQYTRFFRRNYERVVEMARRAVLH